MPNPPKRGPGIGQGAGKPEASGLGSRTTSPTGTQQTNPAVVQGVHPTPPASPSSSSSGLPRALNEPPKQPNGPSPVTRPAATPAAQQAREIQNGAGTSNGASPTHGIKAGTNTVNTVAGGPAIQKPSRSVNGDAPDKTDQNMKTAPAAAADTNAKQDGRDATLVGHNTASANLTKGDIAPVNGMNSRPLRTRDRLAAMPRSPPRRPPTADSDQDKSQDLGVRVMARLDDVSKLQGEYIQASETKQDKTDQQLRSLRETVEALRGEKKTAEQRVEGLEGEVKALEEERSTLTNDIDYFEQRVKDGDAAILEWEDRYSTLARVVIELEQVMARMAAQLMESNRRLLEAKV